MRLSTEQNNPATKDIDRVDTLTALRMIHEEDKNAVRAMEAALPALGRAVDEIAARLANGGRLFYVGAGTSGRIGVLDASELPATYGVDPSLVKAIVPGGYDTLPDARLGDEDDRAGARVDFKAEGLCEKDAVVGIAASGRTPYTHEALVYANECGAFTAAIVNVENSLLASAATVAVVSDTGAEVIEGSTRMKAGTTQKLALNMLSTAVMIKLGKVYGNRMVEMTVVNDKLVARSERMLRELTGADEQTCAAMLAACDYQVKTACVAIVLGCDAETAKKMIAERGGKLGDWL
ncbi:MAG: N-acetylmuramic acid 6-phosphate etherase [Clostridia bacterium]|nr:N-acetylmuramic acid 6-phosphate etherase [Clostridia bacterium]